MGRGGLSPSRSPLDPVALTHRGQEPGSSVPRVGGPGWGPPTATPWRSHLPGPGLTLFQAPVGRERARRAVATHSVPTLGAWEGDRAGQHGVPARGVGSCASLQLAQVPYHQGGLKWPWQGRACSSRQTVGSWRRGVRVCWRGLTCLLYPLAWAAGGVGPAGVTVVTVLADAEAPMVTAAHSVGYAGAHAPGDQAQGWGPREHVRVLDP